MKSDLLKLKIHKDLGFLLGLPKQRLNNTIVKYVIKQGSGERLYQIQGIFDACLLSSRYDYSGKVIQRNHARMKISSTERGGLKNAIFTMRVGEEAWFNIQDQEKAPELSSETISELVQDDFDQNQINEQGQDEELYNIEEKDNGDNPDPTGLHHHIVLESLEFKNDETIVSKRRVYEQNRAKGKQLFESKKFQEAARVYKLTVNITQNLPKKRYKLEELKEIEQFHIKSKQNFLRCYLKLEKEFQSDDLNQNVQEFMNSLLNARPKDSLTHFLHAKHLLRQGLFDSALDAGKKSYSILRDKDTEVLIQQIEFNRANKGKIKILKSQLSKK